MGGEQSRSVESRSVKIQISNKTKNFTLEKPRTHFESGRSVIPPSPELSPGSSGFSRFVSDSDSSPLGGLVTYEAESFTLAILFLLPVNLETQGVKLGLELSLDKAHLGNLHHAFCRMLGRRGPYSHDGTFGDIRDIHPQHQEPAQVCPDQVKVTATMSHGQNAVIKVVVAEQGDGRKKTRGKGKDGHGKCGAAGPSGEPLELGEHL